MNKSRLIPALLSLSLPVLALAQSSRPDRRVVTGPEAQRLYDSSRAAEEPVLRSSQFGPTLCKVDVGSTCTARQGPWDEKSARVILTDYHCEVQLGQPFRDYSGCGGGPVSLATCPPEDIALSCTQPTGPRCLLDEHHALACGVGAAYVVVVTTAQARGLPNASRLLKDGGVVGCQVRCQIWTEGTGGEAYQTCMQACVDGND